MADKDFLVKNGLVVANGNIAVSGTVDGRDIAADGTKLDGIESGATADQTASEILTAIKTVDGASSGLDADLLDGQHGSYYLDWTNTTNKPDPVITLAGDLSGSVTLTDLTSGTLTATIVADSVALGTDTTGNYVASITNGSYITGGNGGSEGAALTLAVDAATAATASKVVARDASGNFSANTITAALSGNATTATTLQTARTIAISGDVTGTATSFNGSSNITISSAITADSIVNADINSVAAIADTKLATISTAGKVLNSATTATSANTASAIVARDASGNFTAGTITAALSGNATTATTLQTARTIGGVSFDGSANINLPGVNATGNQNTTGSAATLTTGRTITLSGDVAGSISFNGGSDVTITTTVQPNSVELGTDTTGNYVAGLTAGTGVTISGSAGEGWSPTVAIGQAVSTTSDVEFRNLILSGNLVINGTTTTVSATELSIEDNLIYLNANSTVTNPDIGIVGNYNDGTYAHTGVFRDATDGRWKFFKGYVPEPGQTIDTANNTFQYADVQANTIYAALSGNATTATTLATGRTISLTGDVTYTSGSFNGSANVTGTATLANSGVTANTYGSSTAIPVITVDAKGRITSASTSAITVGDGTLTLGVSGVGLSGSQTFTANQGTNATFTVTSNATNANTPSTIVSRDASGNFTAGTVTAALSGNATTATTLQTARTIAISGDVTGTATSFNGSTDITISAGITANTIVNADINTSAAIADTKLATISTAGKVSNAATTATNLNTASAIVARDASGNFTAGTITAALSGNATTASTWATGRTLTIGATGKSVDGSAAVSWTRAEIEVPRTTTSTSIGIETDESCIAYVGSISLFGQTDGALYSHAYSSSWKHQIFGDYRTGQIAIRGRNNGTWQAWRTVLDSSNYNSYAPTLTGTGASGNWGIQSIRVTSPDGDRIASNKLPTTSPQSVRFDFANASSVGTAGNYAGVMTYAPWTGTTASTGDSSYQLVFGNASGFNASGPAQLRLRNGIDSTWNSWQVILDSSNYNSYAPTLTGTGASGNWGINVTGSSGSTTGNAATATTLQTARTIAISGDVTGTATSFNGSANISIAADITANTIVNDDISSSAAIADTKLATISTAGKVSNSATTATSANTANAIVARDAAGDFSANVMTGTATRARYADLAEKYLADKEYPVGTVMSVGGELEITASTIENSHSIAGVVSNKPAYLMNNDLEGGTIIALRGRVPVLVTGVVNKGDRLTASRKPGYAIADNDATRSFAIALHDSNGNEIVEAIIL